MEKEIELILAFRQGNEKAFLQLCDKYNALLDSLSNRYYSICLDNGEKEDFLQESKIALCDAALGFDVENSKVTFGAYAKVCVRNRLVSYLRKCKAKKRQSNNFAIATEEADEASFEQIELREFEQQLTEQERKLLSGFENKVFDKLVLKMSAEEISVSLGKSVKSVNNAIYRARKKLRKTRNEQIT